MNFLQKFMDDRSIHRLRLNARGVFAKGMISLRTKRTISHILARHPFQISSHQSHVDPAPLGFGLTSYSPAAWGNTILALYMNSATVKRREAKIQHCWFSAEQYPLGELWFFYVSQDSAWDERHHTESTLEALEFTTYNSQIHLCDARKVAYKAEHTLYKKNLKEGGWSASELGFFQNASPNWSNLEEIVWGISWPILTANLSLRFSIPRHHGARLWNFCCRTLSDKGIITFPE